MNEQQQSQIHTALRTAAPQQLQSFAMGLPTNVLLALLRHWLSSDQGKAFLLSLIQKAIDAALLTPSDTVQ